MPLLDTLPGPSSGPRRREPAKRASKACEACRVRRIRCQGGQPCDGCRAMGREHLCEVRKRARPNRALPARLAPFPETTRRDEQVIAGPVEIIEKAVEDWAVNLGLQIDLSFKDSPRISSHILQPANTPPISELVFKFVNSAPHHLDTIDRNRIETLYNWSRALPGSLTDDQLALLYACLCRATCMGEFMAGEDGVRFFRLAYDHLERCHEHPSLTALSALLILVGYAAAHGGRAETISLLERTADQVRRLGLNKEELASQYGKEAQTERLMFSHYYMDTMVSTVADCAPQVCSSEITFEPGMTALADPFSRRVLHYEAQVLETMRDRPTSCLRDDFILDMESRCSSFFKELRDQKRSRAAAGVDEVHLSWAGTRAHWLHIMLRAPLLHHPTLAASSIALLARSASNILRTYRELAQAGYLNPCWLQFRRILTCAHIVILSYHSGTMHSSEAEELLSIAIELIGRHEPCWEPAVAIKANLELARCALLGISSTSSSNSTSCSTSTATATAISTVGATQPEHVHGYESEVRAVPEQPVVAFAFDPDWMSWIDAEVDWRALLEDTSLPAV